LCPLRGPARAGEKRDDAGVARDDGHEGDALVPILQRARFACAQLVSVGADQGFAAERV